jgi:energy-coupling factor transporter ATP-binding protein EcfA2
VVRIIVVGTSGSGKSTLIEALKPQIALVNNESNEGAQKVIDAWAGNAPSEIFTALIFVADLENEGSLMALSDISKRFRGTPVKVPQFYIRSILVIMYSKSSIYCHYFVFSSLGDLLFLFGAQNRQQGHSAPHFEVFSMYFDNMVITTYFWLFDVELWVFTTSHLAETSNFSLFFLHILYFCRSHQNRQSQVNRAQ